MDSARNHKAIGYGLIVLLVGGSAAAYLASGKTIDWPPAFFAGCEKPIFYSIGTIDPRFDISRAEVESALKESAGLWNTAAGVTVVEASVDGAITVNLVYSEFQRNAELGAAIDAEQQAYVDARDEVEALRSEYLALRSRFETRQAAYIRASKEYDEEVEYWNARGGAPPGEYERLQEKKRDLAREQERVNALVAEVNVAARTLNVEVEELNRLAARTNAKVGTYNKTAGTDFDQGTYTEDRDGKRITIYEFTNRTELKRVLAHEFGHALGLGHVDNPESIMYSYNIGTVFELSEEDVAALKARCSIE